MDFSKLSFDDADEGGFEPLPVGWYSMIVEDVEDKETKAGTGKYLKLTLAVVSEKFKGRKVFHNLNYQNPSSVAESIGKGQLKKLCLAIGKDAAQLKSESELVGKPFACKLSIQPESGQYSAQNRVQEFKSIEAGKAEVKKATVAKKAIAEITLDEDDIPF